MWGSAPDVLQSTTSLTSFPSDQLCRCGALSQFLDQCKSMTSIAFVLIMVKG